MTMSFYEYFSIVLNKKMSIFANNVPNYNRQNNMIIQPYPIGVQTEFIPETKQYFLNRHYRNVSGLTHYLIN